MLVYIDDREDEELNDGFGYDYGDEEESYSYDYDSQEHSYESQESSITILIKSLLVTNIFTN